MRKYVAVVGVSLLYAAFYMVTCPVMENSHALLVFLMSLLLFAGCGLIGLKAAPWVKKWKLTERLILWNRRIGERTDQLLPDRKLFPVLWLVLTVCWIPAYLAWFPGILGYDTPGQIAALWGYETLTSHHPLFHTWLLGLFFKAGELIDNYSAAYAVFTALQTVAVTGSLAASFAFLRRRRVPVPLLLAAMLWVIANPMLQTLTFNATKDILYGASMLLFIISFWELIEPLKPPGKSAYMKVFVSGLLVCLFRNQGIYIFLVLTVFCLLLRMRSKRLYGCLVGIMACYGIFCIFCTNVLKIPEGDKREMLSVPMQQMAAVGYQRLMSGGGNISEDQLQIMEEIIPEQYILAWDSASADPVKSGFETEEFGAHLLRHLNNYIQIGLQNPDIYLETFRGMIAAYWDMNRNPFRTLAFSYTFSDMNRWDIKLESILGFYAEMLMNRGFVDPIPVWNQPAVSIWCMPALAAVAYARRRKTLFLGSLPAILYFGTILLGPVALLRYMYPLMLAQPLLLGMLFCSLITTNFECCQQEIETCSLVCYDKNSRQ